MRSLAIRIRKWSLGVLGACGCVVLISCGDTSPKLLPYIPAEKVVDVDPTADLVFNPSVDILFVVDDSGSMYSHQTTLASNVERFTREIFKSKIVDFHIGVVTSTAGVAYPRGVAANGELVSRGGAKFVGRNTPDGLDALKKNLIVGTDGSATEKFFDPVVRALTDPLLSGYNSGFYRKEAYLVLIFITDTDDQSEGTHPLSFYEFIKDLKNDDTDRIITHAVIVPSDDTSNCRREGYYDKPVRIERFLEVSNGGFFSLCDENYGDKLADLSIEIVKRVQVMNLSRRPVYKTIRVTYGTQVIPNHTTLGWRYDPYRNALLFGDDVEWSEQPEGTRVQVTFDIASDSE